MNERIKELIQAADRKCSETRGVYDEILAELIVRECIDIAQDRANFPGFPPNDVNNIIDEIKEHFGVEE